LLIYKKQRLEANEICDEETALADTDQQERQLPQVQRQSLQQQKLLQQQQQLSHQHRCTGNIALLTHLRIKINCDNH
jgi:hypothetical protein